MASCHVNHADTQARWHAGTHDTQFIKLIERFCEWFIDNKLSIHGGSDKTKPFLSILFLKAKCMLVYLMCPNKK